MTRYELVERIGAGGMAEIFLGRAMAIGGFEKPVAIKKILPHLGSDTRFVQMLIAEAKILSSLRHRNIVQIFDVGLSEEAEYFLVMEFVDGVDLGALYDTFVVTPSASGMRAPRSARRFPVDLVLHIGCEVAEALEHAHRATDSDGKPLGLIHRDVSPANVMLSSAGEVKLTDFGIAKRADNASIVQSIKGKFAYMSPEQARAEMLGPTSDLFSLGIILWELLLGRRLFLRDHDLDVLENVREARVPKPTEIEPDFPRGLEGLLLKLLAPVPRGRFQSAGELGAALRDFRYSAATAAGDPARELSNLVKRFAPKRIGEKADQRPRGEVRLQTVLLPGPATPAPPPSTPDFHDDDAGDATTIDDPVRRQRAMAAVDRSAPTPTGPSHDEDDSTREVTHPRPRTTPAPGTLRTPSSESLRTPSILERIAAQPTRRDPPPPRPTKRPRLFRRASRLEAAPRAAAPPRPRLATLVSEMPLPLQMAIVAALVTATALVAWWLW
jgi:serine/threonine protein kinase